MTQRLMHTDIYGSSSVVGVQPPLPLYSILTLLTPPPLYTQTNDTRRYLRVIQCGGAPFTPL